MTPSVEAEGVVADGWAAVADVFQENFRERADIGAACCVYVDGRPVVDLWGGIAEVEAGRRWGRATPTFLASTTKGITTIAALVLAERGLLDLDAPIAEVWPEFGAAGKDRISLRSVMSHRAGVAALDRPISRADVLAWHPVMSAIAAQAPNWEPGTAQGYHGHTMGWITGEVVRRVSGRSIGTFVADELARPFALDLWIGLPDDVAERVARVVDFPDELRAGLQGAHGSGTLPARVVASPPLYVHELDRSANDAELRRAELPSQNGVATAAALARMYAATLGPVGGARLLGPETIADATRCLSTGEPDLVAGYPRSYGTGFLLAPSLWAATGPGAYGHDGAGGSLAYADPSCGLSFAYVTNHLVLTERWARASALAAAVQACAGR